MLDRLDAAIAGLTAALVRPREERVARSASPPAPSTEPTMPVEPLDRLDAIIAGLTGALARPPDATAARPAPPPALSASASPPAPSTEPTMPVEPLDRLDA